MFDERLLELSISFRIPKFGIQIFKQQDPSKVNKIKFDCPVVSSLWMAISSAPYQWISFTENFKKANHRNFRKSLAISLTMNSKIKFMSEAHMSFQY